MEELERLFENGKTNGVSLELLSRREIKRWEPNINGLAAIHSPLTGILDSQGLMRYFAGKAKLGGAEIVYKSKVIGIEKVAAKHKVTVEDSAGTSSFLTSVLINSAGLNSDRIASLAGIDIAAAGYKLHFSKGEYFSVKKRLTKMLVYPIPKADESGLGIHVTLDLQGRVRLGPNAYYVGEIDYKVDETHKREFYDSAKGVLPSLEYDDLEPEFAGIRPKLQGPGEGFRDFVIRHEDDRGLPGFINLIGIESPGLTASPAIAKYVKEIVSSILQSPLLDHRSRSAT